MDTDAATLIRRFYERVVNAGHVELLETMLAADFQAHGPSRPLDSVRQTILRLREQFPDLSVRIHELVADGDHVAVRWTFSGTDSGGSRDQTPTERQIQADGTAFWRVNHGQILEYWGQSDLSGALHSLYRTDLDRQFSRSDPRFDPRAPQPSLSYVDALAAAGIFFPQVEEVEGMVLHTRRMRVMEGEQFIPYAAPKSWSPAQIERQNNMIEVDALVRSGDTVTDEEERILAGIIADAWRTWLHGRYPGRFFIVEVVEPARTVFGESYAVTFWEERDTQPAES